MSTSKFARKTGKISIPTAQNITPNRKPVQHNIIIDKDLKLYDPHDFQLHHPYKFCYTNLKEGCYTISVTSNALHSFGDKWRGTIRVDKTDDDICISGDLYRVQRYLVSTIASKRLRELMRPELSHTKTLLMRPELSHAKTLYQKNIYFDYPAIKKRIPVYPRRSYYGYLLGTSAYLGAIVANNDPCPFSLYFDFYEFEHDADGFEGTFPLVPTRTVRILLHHTDIDHCYTGTMYEGVTELGSVTMEWVSSYFRKAYLDIHTLQGAEAPQEVDDPDGTGTETFRTIFATAGWDLSVSYKTPDIIMPASLAGIQNSNDCWSRVNSHELLETVSTYDPAELDSKWKVHLIAIEGELGCSRGRMFDNEISATDIGDVNNIAREGAVTYSHDGYDSASFGDNQNDLQKDTPRAFIRSATHEAGHAFNMIHQNDEAGNDNSIMTTSPSVASVLNAAGLDFPEDIELSFNNLCRHHMIHRPDPWVRPGALEFTGSLAGSPEADDVYFYDPSELELELTLLKKNIKLGEILKLSWKATNKSGHDIVLPGQITDSSFIARVGITYPDDSIRYIRPVEVNADIDNPLIILKPGQSRVAGTMLFWNKKGFAFTVPGKHIIEVNLLWADDGHYACVSASEEIWVDYPVTVHENEVAAMLLHKDVGRYVAIGGRKPIKEAIKWIEHVISQYKTHPASVALKDIPGHHYSHEKLSVKKETIASVRGRSTKGRKTKK